MPLTTDFTAVHDIAEKCTDCGKCVRNCLFLQKSGSPGKLAREALQSENAARSIAISSYGCSLCSLCAAVCPAGCDPSKMFSELRNEAHKEKLIGLEAYSPLLKYENTGRKFPFAGQIIPTGCTTAFFPGCTLPGLFPQSTLRTYQALKQQDSSTGLILNCCSKPSISLGISENKESRLYLLIGKIAAAGINEILTACPNCYMTLKSAKPPFKVGTVYSRLRRNKISSRTHEGLKVTIHDPCVTRFETGLHEDVRDIIKNCGVEIVEPEHTKTKTLCCGEGGATSFLDNSLADNWKKLRSADLYKTGLPAVSYCAGCVNFLSTEIRITHVLNLLFSDKSYPPAKKFPFNYTSRVFLKLKAGVSNK